MSAEKNTPQSYTNNLDSRCRFFQEIVVNCNIVEGMYMEYHDLTSEFHFKDKHAEEGFWRTFNNKLCNELTKNFNSIYEIAFHDVVVDCIEECVDEAVDLGIMCLFHHTDEKCE